MIFSQRCSHALPHIYEYFAAVSDCRFSPTSLLLDLNKMTQSYQSVLNKLVCANTEDKHEGVDKA